MQNSIAAARQSYAEELRFTANVRSRAVIAAFAAVPRERFVGSELWRVKSPLNIAEYWTTDDADPRAVYHDVLIALDEERGINNGQPSLWAFLFDRLGIAAGEHVLHLGCGTGYYTAIAAELTKPAGKITAVEIDPALAARARAALALWPQVTVSKVDGARTVFDPVDVIVASAGATHPVQSWLDAMKPGGRLMFPLTTTRSGPGAMLLVVRHHEDEFAARFVHRVGFIDFRGARHRRTGQRLAAALKRDWGAAVNSLRRDSHAKDETSWLHGEGWCLSRLVPASRGLAAS